MDWFESNFQRIDSKYFNHIFYHAICKSPLPPLNSVFRLPFSSFMSITDRYKLTWESVYEKPLLCSTLLPPWLQCLQPKTTAAQCSEGYLSFRFAAVLPFEFVKWPKVISLWRAKSIRFCTDIGDWGHACWELNWPHFSTFNSEWLLGYSLWLGFMLCLWRTSCLTDDVSKFFKCYV